MPDNETLRGMHRQMVRIRIFEETLVQIYMEGKTPAFDIAIGPVPGEMHLAAGQEPVAAGVCAHLRPTDAITATHRPHHQALAHGVDMKLHGGRDLRQGHRARPRQGRPHAPVLDGDLPSAAAASSARASRRRSVTRWPSRSTGRDDIAVSFFGEGAANQGAFHESLNLAALWNLGVVFVCEDNAWAISVPKDTATAIANNSDRAARLRDPGRADPRQRSGRDLRGRRRGRRAGAPRRRTVADRDQDGPPARPLRG